MFRKIWQWIQRFSSPKYFYEMSARLIPWFAAGALVVGVIGVYQGLFVAPPDYQQGESYRIIFVHVPAAWMSLFVYMVVAVSSAIGLIWQIRLADMVASASAPVGAWFTFLALVTGSLWGKPMWGAYWVWDARLTSELILLFLYFGYMALQSAIEDQRTADKASGLLAIVGVVNIPIIHYSVEWWNTLHQGATVAKFDKPSMDVSMLIPLLLMALAFKLFYFAVVLVRTRNEALYRDRNRRWVRELIEKLPPAQA